MFKALCLPLVPVLTGMCSHCSAEVANNICHPDFPGLLSGSVSVTCPFRLGCAYMVVLKAANNICYSTSPASFLALFL